MKHKKDFNDKNFAERYIKKHTKITEKLGYDYAKTLASLGFEKGKILDVGCGFGAMDAVLAKEIPGCEIIGIDLSEPLLEYANLRKGTFSKSVLWWNFEVC